MLSLAGPYNSGQTAGGAGVSTANADTPKVLRGYLVAVCVKYNSTPPATTDLTIKTKGTSPSAPSKTLLTLTNNNTDGWYYPRANVHDTSGNAQATVWDLIPIFDIVNVEVDQSNDATSVDVWLLIDQPAGN